MQTRLKQKHGMGEFPQKIHCQTTLGNTKHRKANKSKSKRTLPSSLPFITHKKTLRIPLQKAGKSGGKKRKKRRHYYFLNHKREAGLPSNHTKKNLVNIILFPSPFKARNPKLKHKTQRKRSKIQDEINNNNNNNNKAKKNKNYYYGSDDDSMPATSAADDDIAPKTTQTTPLRRSQKTTPPPPEQKHVKNAQTNAISSKFCDARL